MKRLGIPLLIAVLLHGSLLATHNIETFQAGSVGATKSIALTIQMNSSKKKEILKKEKNTRKITKKQPVKSKKNRPAKKITKKQPVKSKKISSVKKQKLLFPKKKVPQKRQMSTEVKNTFVEEKEKNEKLDLISKHENQVSKINDERLEQQSENGALTLKKIETGKGNLSKELPVPNYLLNVLPVYPRMAKRRGYQGTVILNVLVDISGDVRDLEVFQSSGYKILDRAALKAVRSWSFSASAVQLHSKEVWVKLPVEFKLNNLEQS